jgi:hypothetical protein
MADPEKKARKRRGLVTTLIVLASLIGILAVFAVWANRQLLETDTWTDTSGKLLEDEDIRTAVGGFLVDQLYANVDVQAELQKRLPPQAAGLAGPLSGGLRELADRAALEALQRPRVQTLWEEANRRAHKQFIDIVENKSDVIQTGNGAATLDLGALLTQVSARSGIGGNLAAKLPPDAAQITIVRSDQIGFAQDAVRLLRSLAIGLTALALVLFALAVYLARGWRRVALRSVGVGFVMVGLTVLVARSLAGSAVVGALTTTPSVEPAANSAWEIGTSLLRAGAVAMVGYGVLIILAAWLAGPSRAATTLRRGLAPYLRERLVAYTALAVIVLLVLWWNPTPGTSRLLPTLVLIALLVAGLEALRHLTLREFPDAERGELSAALRGSMGSRRRAATPSPEDERLQSLEKLAELQAAGVLTEAEVASEKQRILGAA